MLGFGLVAYFHGDRDRGIGMSVIGAICTWTLKTASAALLPSSPLLEELTNLPLLLFTLFHNPTCIMHHLFRCKVVLPGSYASTVIYGTYVGWSGYSYSELASYDDWIRSTAMFCDGTGHRKRAWALTVPSNTSFEAFGTNFRYTSSVLVYIGIFQYYLNVFLYFQNWNTINQFEKLKLNLFTNFVFVHEYLVPFTLHIPLRYPGMIWGSKKRKARIQRRRDRRPFFLSVGRTCHARVFSDPRCASACSSEWIPLKIPVAPQYL